jgi:hypothetical protein
LEMEMVLMLMLGMIEMLMEKPPLMPRRSGDDDEDNSPSSEASEQPDLPSPRVGEDFHLHRRHCKSWENMASVKGRRRYHARGPNGPGVPRPGKVVTPPRLFWPSWPSPLDSCAHNPSRD